MPVTIKTASMKYKDPESGEYIGIDAVAETTTAEQVATIKAAGQQERAAIEQKGEDTLASISLDYTELSGQVSELKSAFTNLKSHADTVDALSLFVNYNDIASFTLTPAAIEIGNATASVTLAWTFYATPASLTLNGVSKSVSSSGETVTATDDDSTHQVTYTLATSIGSKTEAFHFYPNSPSVPGRRIRVLDSLSLFYGEA